MLGDEVLRNTDRIILEFVRLLNLFATHLYQNNSWQSILNAYGIFSSISAIQHSFIRFNTTEKVLFS